MEQRLRRGSGGGAWQVMIRTVLGLFLLGGVAWADDLRPFTRFRARLERVFDGDTIGCVVKGEKMKVRLIGVDTFESSFAGGAARRAQMQAERFGKPVERVVELGRLGKRFVEAELRGVLEIDLETEAETHDRYGRVLAHVYLPGGKELNARIIEAGFGVPLCVKPNCGKAEEYEQLHREARAGRKGLWRDF